MLDHLGQESGCLFRKRGCTLLNNSLICGTPVLNINVKQGGEGGGGGLFLNTSHQCTNRF